MNGDYPRSGRTVEAGGGFVCFRTPGLRPGTRALSLAACALLLGACGSSAPEGGKGAGSNPAAAPGAERAAGPTSAAARIRPPTDDARPAGVEGPLVVFLGDSLTAGYGLSEEQSFPSIIADRLRESGRAVRIVNAGVSGDTSAGGLERLDWVLRQHPDVLVVGLGANDALRGQPLEGVERNLLEIVRRSQAAGARVLLLGLKIPVNYGPDYGDDFSEIFPRVARDSGAALVPFLLDGVGGRAELNLADGIHPNRAGQEIVASNVLPHLLPLLSPPSPLPN